MAKRFTKPAIIWKELEKRVPPDQKAQFLAFKGKADVYLRRVEANPPEPPKINWEEFKKSVPVQGLVDKLKSEYEGFKVPFPADTMSAKVDEQWEALQPAIQGYCAEQQKLIDSATKELNRVRALPKFEEMTMEMVYDLYPNATIDPVKRPTFWPHTPDEQEGYAPSVAPGAKKGGH